MAVIAGRARSDDEGRATFAKLDPGVYQVTVRRKNASAVAFRVFDVRAGATARAELVVLPGSFTLTLTDFATGDPSVGVSVMARAIADLEGRALADERVVETAKTDDRGVALLEGLAPARYQVWVTGPKRSAESAEVVVRPGEASDAGSLTIR